MILSDQVSNALEAARADAARGRWSGARDHLAAVQAGIGDRPEAQLLLAEALFWTGDPGTASDWLGRALPLVTKQDDRARLRRSHLLAGAAGLQLGEVDDAVSHFQRALELAQADGDDLVAAQASNNLGAISDMRGVPLEALSRYRAAVPAYQRLGHVRGLAETFHNMAITYRQQGELRKAEELELDSLRHAQSVGESRLAALAHLERAVIRLALGDASFAAALADMAGREFETLGLGANQADALRVRGLARHALGENSAALGDLDDAIALIARAPGLLVEAECYRDRAVVLNAMHELVKAREDAGRAVEYFERLGALREAQAVRALLRTLDD